MTFEYQTVLDRILQEGEESISDKEAGVRLGVSERFIRNCKQGMTDIQADELCTRGLGLHPSIVYDDPSLDRYQWVVDTPAFHAELEATAVASETVARRRRKKKAS